MIGNRLKKLREKMNLTQQEVADRLHISRGTYAHYEIDKRNPDFNTAQLFADFFGVTVDHLLGRDEQKEPADTPDEPADLKEILKESAVFYEGIELSDEDKQKIDDYVRFMFWDLEKQKRKKD